MYDEIAFIIRPHKSSQKYDYRKKLSGGGWQNLKIG